MCGIFGHTDLKHFSEENSITALDSMIHRGPNDRGFITEQNIFMGHRRLSILDLSAKGHQPMQQGQVYLSANGEIYNFIELREELIRTHNAEFKSESDSEVLLHGYIHWGLNTLLEKIDGMFGFTILDLDKNVIHIARDHAGIKPLYYGYIEGTFSWSSELKGIEMLYKNTDKLVIDPTSIYDFMTYQYIPSPKSLYKNVFKLEPGCTITFDLKTKELHKKRYWSLDDYTHEDSLSYEDSKKKIVENLQQSVKEQLVSDVPVGTFLSGGVDSSIISYEVAQCIKEVNSFCQGNQDPKADESKYAQMVAETIKSTHHSRFFNQSILNENKSLIKNLFDEPFAQPSCYPTYEVCRHASEHVTVVLTGDGGDELFGGYGRFKLGDTLFTKKAKHASKRDFICFLKRLPIHRTLKRRLQKFEVKKCIADPIEHYAILAECRLKTDPHKEKWAKMHKIPKDYDDFWFIRQFDRPNLTPRKRLQFIDFNTYMPEAVLTKVDRASMAVSIETRVPFLSKRVIAAAFSTPEKHLYKENETKGILKETYQDKLPTEVLYRRKQGFTAGRASKKDFLYSRERNLPLLILNKMFSIKI